VTLFNFVDPVTKISSSGKRAPYAPIFTSGINIGFRSARGWFASGNIAAAGKTFYTETEDPRFAQGAYAVVGARAGFESRRWSITAYVANACDKSYYSQIIPAVDSASPGAPRTMGSELMVRF
jgi:outer membrane receptor for ferric coprogen and ferric-rhodotorulic acid